MKKHELYLPQLALIAGTRAMAGAGLGLLLAPRLRDEHRKAIGWTLLAVGALTTIPLLAEVLRHPEHDDGDEVESSSDELHHRDALGHDALTR